MEESTTKFFTETQLSFLSSSLSSFTSHNLTRFLFWTVLIYLIILSTISWLLNNKRLIRFLRLLSLTSTQSIRKSAVSQSSLLQRRLNPASQSINFWSNTKTKSTNPWSELHQITLILMKLTFRNSLRFQSTITNSTNLTKCSSWTTKNFLKKNSEATLSSEWSSASSTMPNRLELIHSFWELLTNHMDWASCTKPSLELELTNKLLLLKFILKLTQIKSLWKVLRRLNLHKTSFQSQWNLAHCPKWLLWSSKKLHL